MLTLIKQVFIALLSFSGSLTNLCVSLNDELCMIRPTLIDLNPVELNHYPFMFSLGKCSRSFNIADGLPTKICVPCETKDVNV